MSPSSPRRPSTLAARQFAAATRPIGARPPGGEADGMMGVGRTSVERAPAPSSRLVSAAPLRNRPVSSSGAGASRGPTAKPAPSAPASVAPADARRADGGTMQRRVDAQQKESVIITGLLVALVFVGVAIATWRVSGSMRLERSRQQIDGTFTRVFVQQGDYRVLTGRFATWPELRARGVKLGPRQRVVASNASASHWFLAVRDTGTGVICSRTGELFDESPRERPPTCSTER